MIGRRILPPLLLATALAAGGCADDGGTQPGTLRFGQIGEIRLHLTSPLLVGRGELQQALTWNSTGPWTLTETISYNGRLGDENTLRSAAPPEVLAREYAIWITQVNDLQTLNLFDAQLVPHLSPPPVCGAARTKIQLLIRDTALGEDREWVRCVEGTLGSLVTEGALPDVGAARVAMAALLVRESVFPPPRGFLSSYHGSYPFGTAVRGDDTPVAINSPTLIRSFEAWTEFWIGHTGSVAGLPPVDFNREVVVVASIGQRFEAGESVEVRRVLAVGEGTLVEVVHRIPGNFCSPVSRTHRPFHVVIIPTDQVPEPILFGDVIPEVVPCG
jgi:hypothetical protein